MSEYEEKEKRFRELQKRKPEPGDVLTLSLIHI